MTEYQWGVRSKETGDVITYIQERNARLAIKMLDLADKPHELVRRPVADWGTVEDSGHWLFTFGAGHVHPTTGLPLDKRYALAPWPLSYNEARKWMVDRFGIQWCAQYDAAEDGDPAGEEKYGLTALTVDEIPEVHNE